jgi:hypothetical protein
MIGDTRMSDPELLEAAARAVAALTDGVVHTIDRRYAKAVLAVVEPMIRADERERALKAVHWVGTASGVEEEWFAALAAFEKAVAEARDE